MVRQIVVENRLERSPARAVSSHISPWLIRLVYPLGCYGVLPTFFNRITVIGREHIPLNGPVIVAPTHRSRWDALLVPYAIGRLASGRDLRFMVTANELQGFQGWWIERLGGFPIDVHNPKLSSLTHSVELLRQGEMVVIFPEGGIIRSPQVGSIKRGVAKIALEVVAQAPQCGIKILPMSIRYSQTYPAWGSEVQMMIGQPLSVADYWQRSSKQASGALTLDLKQALQDLHEPKVRDPQTVLI